MHFKTQKNNIISEFHIERWDAKALGKELINRINSYKGKPYEEFILFALKNRLFFKLRMLFYLTKKKTIYFWGCGIAYGSEDEKPMKMLAGLGISKDVLKYAKFYLKGKNEPNLTSVLCENALESIMREFKYEPEEMWFELNEEDIKDITSDFNISRNGQNLFHLLRKYDPNDYKKEELMTAQIKKLAFIAINGKTGALRIFKEEEVSNITADDLSKYRTLSCTPHDKESEEKIKSIMKRIDDIKEKNKDLFTDKESEEEIKNIPEKSTKQDTIFNKIKRLFYG